MKLDVRKYFQFFVQMECLQRLISIKKETRRGYSILLVEKIGQIGRKKMYRKQIEY